jgi:hypothetical protein
MRSRTQSQWTVFGHTMTQHQNGFGLLPSITSLSLSVHVLICLQQDKKVVTTYCPNCVIGSGKLKGHSGAHKRSAAHLHPGCAGSAVAKRRVSRSPVRLRANSHSAAEHDPEPVDSVRTHDDPTPERVRSSSFYHISLSVFTCSSVLNRRILWLGPPTVQSVHLGLEN